jgi:hypothetical protein
MPKPFVLNTTPHIFDCPRTRHALRCTVSEAGLQRQRAWRSLHASIRRPEPEETLMQLNSRFRLGMALITLGLNLAIGAPAAAQSDRHGAGPAYSSTEDLTDVHLFNSWVADAIFTPGVDVEPAFLFSFYDQANLWFGGARTAIWVAPNVEVGGRFGWAGANPDNGPSGSSFGDLDLFARYRLPVEFPGTLAAGTEVRLPTGSEDAGQDNTFVRIFGALRQDMGGAFTFTANLAFEYLDFLGDDANGIAVGLGSLIPINGSLTAIVEFNLKTSFEYAIVTGGFDYELPPGGHLRAAVGIGLDNEAPDVELQIALGLPVF